MMAPEPRFPAACRLAVRKNVRRRRRPPRRTPALVVVAALCGTAAGQHGHHPTMPGMKFYLHVYLGDGSDRAACDEEIILASTAAPATPSQKIKLPASWPVVTVAQYLPNAELRQRVVPTSNEHGRPAIELTIAGPSQSYTRWLIAGDVERNRLMSVIGTWRIMAVNESQRASLLSQFKTELTRPPVLRVSRDGDAEVSELQLNVGETAALQDSNCSLTLLNFFPHYGLDADNAHAVNQSPKRINPAAQIEIECGGARKRTWVFAKFPGYSLKSRRSTPFRVLLDCPAAPARETPAYLLGAGDQGPLELWSRFQNKTDEYPLELGQWVGVPGSRYRFRVDTLVPRGELHESFEPVTTGGGPALKLSVDNQNGGSTDLWLVRNKPRSLRTGAGLLTFLFDARKTADSEGRHDGPTGRE